MIIHAISAEVRAEIEKTAREYLREYGLQAVEIEAREDSVGEESIFVDLRYGPGGKKTDPTLRSEIQYQVTQRLVDLGEYRFPFVRHWHHEKPGTRP